MAGSYEHCINDDGTFNDKLTEGMIENLGDAHEALEHMYWMIQVLTEGQLAAIKYASDEAYARKRQTDG